MQAKSGAEKAKKRKKRNHSALRLTRLRRRVAQDSPKHEVTFSFLFPHPHRSCSFAVPATTAAETFKMEPWFKRLAPMVAFARERDRPLPENMFDEDMTDIGEDSDTDESKGANTKDYYKYSYNGKYARLYYQLKPERDKRKRQLRVERRVMKGAARKVNAVAEWNTVGNHIDGGSL
jgi:hypothetical protein